MEDYDAIIIGAGISGLTAARQLYDFGLRNFILVEAQDYVGGRIKTDTSWGTPIELGAEFIHGSNTVTAHIAEQLHLDLRESFGARKITDSSGVQLSPEKLEVYDALLEYTKSDGRLGLSIAEMLHNNPLTHDAELIQLAERTIEDFEAADADSIDSGTFSSACKKTHFLGDNVVLRNGYKDIINYLSKDINIKLSTVVKSVDTSRDNTVTIHLENGHSLTTRCLIMTVSLGVLKSKAIRFIPELPTDKLAVIDRLGMGNACKVFIKLSSPTTARQLYQVADAANEGIMTVTNWWESVASEQILVGYCGGSRVKKLLENDESYLRDKIIDDLSVVLGRDISEEVDGFRISRWDTNPYIRGSYSYHPIDSVDRDNQILAEPTGRLLWAGEATQGDGNYAMVHGAIESGYRAANEAIEILRSA